MDSAEVILPPCMLPQLSSSESQSTSKGACPWGKISTTESVSLNDVMSEQLAKVLQKEEEIAVVAETKRYPEPCYEPDLVSSSPDSDTCDDLLLAQMLQLEFDKEHDGILKQEEMKFNGSSKVSVSFDNYRRLPKASFSDDDDSNDDELLELQEKKHWNNFEEAEKTLQAVGKSGVSRQGNITTTKHDIVMCGRRNASKLMEFPPSIDTGDSFDMNLSNKVYNKLKVHSRAEDRRGNKVHDKKEKATAEKTVDAKTRLILYKLVNGGVFEAVNGCISTGKEAGVYHASGFSESANNQQEYALKVFKTTLNEFQNRDEYIKDDYRFRDRFNRQNPRKVIHMWAEKEMRNLMRIKKANIPCPEVVALKKHVLVMSFIGSDTIPAPKLKEVIAPFEDMTIMYEQTLDIMKTLYSECQLVHADLSEYNLLWHDGKVWVIDVSQAVEVTHSRALEFLLRDCRNICTFFEKRGVIDVLKSEALFTNICGYESIVLREEKPKKIENIQWTPASA